MNRMEFIDTLQRALSGSLGRSSVNENIRYYQEYIDTQIRTGQAEQEVIDSLGDPRLLAKSIIEAARNENRSYSSTHSVCDEVYEDGVRMQKNQGFSPRSIKIPSWLILIIILLLVVLVLGIVGTIVTTLLPILIPVICVVLVYRAIQKRR
ncbi:MAG: hypothetical protein IKM28_06925 [Lachnospiraceae bacterium]|nr:hypothetical protein [Lachnospiraceae bacterium]